MLKHLACTSGALLLLVPGLFAQDNKWSISPFDSFANFSVKHLVISKATGKIGGMKGTVVYDPKDPSKDSVEATLDVRTFNSGVDKRDEQVKTDYFEVSKYPTITFKSTKVTAASDGGLSVTGNLTIKGTTKQVVLDCDPPSPPVKDAQGRSKIGITATTKISRKDFGVVGDALDGAVEAGGIIVSDQVSIELDIEIMPPSQASIVGPAKH
ncbi:MAG TPA: YceI family protein [Bryobacteraceae bacterium]|jgi:polyisoprenoid-binding protein YceI